MSALTNLIPLLILFIVLGGGAFIGYQIYLWSNEMTDRGKKHMEKKNMSFTKEGGLKVGVKEVKDEQYTDKTQNVLVNVWNNSGFSSPSPATASSEKKSWLGGSGSGSSTPRPNSSRTPSTQSQSRPADSRTTSSASARGAENLAPPMPRGSSKRSSSPVPGGWS